MNWTDERYVRVYTRDTTDWLALSWQAQGLFCLLLRKVDRAGLLDLGRQGKAGLASHVGGQAAWHGLEPALEELLADGCVELSGSCLLIRNFIEAQEAKQTDKVRQAESRNRRREQIRGERHEPSRAVTRGHAVSHAVTGGHTLSPDVTPSCAVPSRAVLNRAVPIAPTESAATDAGSLDNTHAEDEGLGLDVKNQDGDEVPVRAKARANVEVFRLEAQNGSETKPRKLSPAETHREALRAMRAAALPGVVEDAELKPSALTATFERLEREATSRGATVRDAYAAFLRDDYARSRNPPCPLPLFVGGNKFRECLSADLRAKGRGPPLTLVSSRHAGGYASLPEIEAQDFTVDPAPRPSSGQAQEAP